MSVARRRDAAEVEIEEEEEAGEVVELVELVEREGSGKKERERAPLLVLLCAKLGMPPPLLKLYRLVCEAGPAPAPASAPAPDLDIASAFELELELELDEDPAAPEPKPKPKPRVDRLGSGVRAAPTLLPILLGRVLDPGREEVVEEPEPEPEAEAEEEEAEAPLPRARADSRSAEEEKMWWESVLGLAPALGLSSELRLCVA